jgi:hypothetical protein
MAHKSHYHVVKDFFGEAKKMRNEFDAHFIEPSNHGSSHQIWNYWHVPRTYTYMRTSPEKLLPTALIESFVARLKNWSLHHLGFDTVTYPMLSLYVNGCGQALHNDATNGRWGYVFSITNWQERNFEGGETIIFPKEDYWNSPKSTQAGAGTNFYTLVEAEFNQLLVFDDRAIHGVERIVGSMNPLEGRVVLHGHITEGDFFVEGALKRSEVAPLLATVPMVLRETLEQHHNECKGILSFKIFISPSGEIDDIVLLSNLLSQLVVNSISPEQLTSRIVTVLGQLRFPKKDRSSIMILPFKIG